VQHIQAVERRSRAEHADQRAAIASLADFEKWLAAALEYERTRSPDETAAAQDVALPAHE